MGDDMTDSLLSRLQALTEPNREIDAEIFERFGVIDEQHCRDWCSMNGRTDLTRKDFIKAWSPTYSASLDAALTLMPDDLTWELAKWLTPQGEVIYYADFHTRRECQGRHSLPAIALLIAIMKAKEESKNLPAPPSEDKP